MIEGFANGRSYDPETVYLVTVNNYILGNDQCGLRRFSTEDALWAQMTDDAGGTIQDSIREYITDRCADGGTITPEDFSWNWYITWSADPADLPPYEGTVSAVFAKTPLDGRRYVIYHEAQECTLTDRPNSGGFSTTGIPCYGSSLVEPLPEDAQVFTVHPEGEDMLTLTDARGQYLNCSAGGGLSLTEEKAENNQSLWQLVPVNGGYHLKPAGAEKNLALQFYGGKISTYRPDLTEAFLFNFYEVAEGT